MLGKRPRPILRTTSKSQLMPKSPSDSPPVRSDEPKALPSPAPAPPRLVIGFNLVSQKCDRDESPRSVMEPKALVGGLAKVSSLERSPRSPRSGLECLLSGSPSGNPQKSEQAVPEPAVTRHAKEDDAAKGFFVEMVEESVVLFTDSVSFEPCSHRSPTPSQPIPIAPIHLLTSFRGKTQLSRAVEEGARDASARRRDGVTDQGRGVCVLWDDEDGVKQESIFSTSSPASSCNENAGDFALADFLSACFFCKRHLAPGKDIFMYRGDRAFCTAECRYKQIVIDERKERCAAATNKATVAVTSSTTNFRSKVMAATTAAAA